MVTLFLQSGLTCRNKECTYHIKYDFEYICRGTQLYFLSKLSISVHSGSGTKKAKKVYFFCPLGAEEGGSELRGNVP